MSKYQTEMAGGEFNRGTHQAAHYLEQNTAAAAPVGRYTGPVMTYVLVVFFADMVFCSARRAMMSG